ncbi:hypothetical protein JYU34_005014 [Plutella xylostella]|uniref:Uncharacterized protein n=1 Tax=Plutella xylostella TaxID=51655 RepID=A0ABQ7QVR0_PLUXY|nr:hypothetical protein JYU34_005014 [Plutella xylostella]
MTRGGGLRRAAARARGAPGVAAAARWRCTTHLPAPAPPARPASPTHSIPENKYTEKQPPCVCRENTCRDEKVGSGISYEHMYKYGVGLPNASKKAATADSMVSQ